MIDLDNLLSSFSMWLRRSRVENERVTMQNVAWEQTIIKLGTRTEDSVINSAVNG